MNNSHHKQEISQNANVGIAKIERKKPIKFPLRIHNALTKLAVDLDKDVQTVACDASINHLKLHKVSVKGLLPATKKEKATVRKNRTVEPKGKQFQPIEAKEYYNVRDMCIMLSCGSSFFQTNYRNHLNNYGTSGKLLFKWSEVQELLNQRAKEKGKKKEGNRV